MGYYRNRQEVLRLGGGAAVPTRLYTVSTLQALSGSTLSMHHVTINIFGLEQKCTIHTHTYLYNSMHSYGAQVEGKKSIH